MREPRIGIPAGSPRDPKGPPLRPPTLERSATPRRLRPLTLLAASVALLAAAAPAAARPLRPAAAPGSAAAPARPDSSPLSARGTGPAGIRTAGAPAFALPGPMVPPAAAPDLTDPGPSGPGTDTGVPLPPGHESPAPGHGPFDPLVRLSAQRLLLTDQVAAAKLRTGAPVDDPARESQVLEAAAAEAAALGDDPAAARRLLTGQFAAARLVERALLAGWAADPASAPDAAPPLSRLRATLDGIDVRLVSAWHDTAALRPAPGCEIRLTGETRSVAGELGLDAAHTAALTRALAGTCR